MRLGSTESGTCLQLQDAVQTAHDTSDAFSDETLREQKIFQMAKEAEVKEVLGNYADGQIEFYKAVGLRLVTASPPANVGSYRLWRNGTGLYLLSSAYEWTFSRTDIFLLGMLFVVLIHLTLSALTQSSLRGGGVCSLWISDKGENYVAFSLPFCSGSLSRFSLCSDSCTASDNCRDR